MHDFVAIGDTVVDAFIKLKEAQVTCDVSKIHCTITLSFGDKVPYESVEVVPAVGNSANAAVAAAKLGLKSALISNLGSDENGRLCLESLKKNGVDTSFVKSQEGAKTNYHYVLWYDDDRTILVKHEQYDYVLPDLGAPRWLYLSSLGPSTEKYHETINRYLEEHPYIGFAFQPGTFQINMIDKLGGLLKKAKVFFCNADEAGRILKTKSKDIDKLLQGLKALGPQIVVITNGAQGAYAFDGQKTIFQAPYPDPKPPYERTGAGDAFASTTVAALALGKDLHTALSWAAVNAMSVVQQVGAQKGLLSREEIEKYFKPHLKNSLNN